MGLTGQLGMIQYLSGVARDRVYYMLKVVLGWGQAWFQIATYVVASTEPCGSKADSNRYTRRIQPTKILRLPRKPPAIQR